MNCPDCDRMLHGETVCRCGWKRPEALPVVDQARAVAIAAMIQREIQAKQPEAEEFCRQHNLHTVEQMREWIRGRGPKRFA
jgi:hypothetical protein